jgi:HD superfamily phosphodiesterase
LSKYLALKKYLSTYLQKELASDLHYHGFHHTMDVMKYVNEIAKAEKISKADHTLLKAAVLLHDAGFTKTYIGHEEYGCELAVSLLPNFEFNQEEIDKICGMIQATKIPQKPKTLLEKIIADADLLYLGTKRFKEVGDTLFEEMKIYSGLHSAEDWNKIQKKFLENHHYHTEYCHRVYEPAKQKNLKKIIAIIQKDN